MSSSVDVTANLTYTTVYTAPQTGTTGSITLQVAPGTGANFPTVGASGGFNCTVWPRGAIPLAGNAEIIRVTAITGDTFTILRAQEGTTQQPINVGYQIANTATALLFTQIEAAITQGNGVNFSAGSTSGFNTAVTFGNANGVSFGFDGTNITASVANAGGAITGVVFSGSNSVTSASALSFVNGNGVSWSLNGGSLYGSIATNPQVIFSAANTSSALSAWTFANANLVSWSLVNGQIQASIPSAFGLMSGIAGTQTATSGGIYFSNSNNVSFGMSNSSLITASANAIGTASALTANGVSMTANTSGLSLNFPAFLTTARASTDGIGLNTAITANGVSWTANSSGESWNFPAFLTTAAQSSAVVTLSQWDSPVSWNGALQALGLNSIYLRPFDLPNYQSVYRLNLFGSINTAALQASNSTWAFGQTVSAAIYSSGTGANSSVMLSMWSGSFYYAATGSSNSTVSMTLPNGIANSTSFATLATAGGSTLLSSSLAGYRVVPIPVSSVMSPGRYWFAFANSSSSANISQPQQVWEPANVSLALTGFTPFGTISSAVANGMLFMQGLGTFSVTSGAFPSTIAFSNGINPLGSSPLFNLSGFTTATTVL